MPPDREKVSLALKAAGCAFTSIEDLLDNVNRIDAENSSCVKQVCYRGCFSRRSRV